jgi:hypothetical protein
MSFSKKTLKFKTGIVKAACCTIDILGTGGITPLVLNLDTRWR